MIECVTFVYNRTGERIANSLMSLRAQSNAPPLGITMVDSSTEPDCIRSNARICAKFGARHIHLKTSKNWNKSRALNYAIRRSNAPYIATFDIDMIFSPDTMALACRILRENLQAILVCRVYDLPPNADITDLEQYATDGWLHPEVGVGGLQIAPRSVFHLLQGYDEAMEFWGGMDLDFFIRALHLGCRAFWLNEYGVKAFHQFHPRNIKGQEPYHSQWKRNNEQIGSALVKNGENWGEVGCEVIKRNQIQNPELSVVLGTYNRKDYLVPCIESIRASSAPLRTEIIVVDGGSMDGAAEWCYQQPDVTLIEQYKLVGCIKAYNAGFAEARAEYVAHLNDDCLLLDHCLHDGYKFLVKYADTVGQIALSFSEDGGKSFEFRQMFGWPYANFSITQKWLGDLCGWWGTEYKKYGGDNLISLMVLQMGYSVMPMSDCRLIHYRLEDELRTPNTDFVKFRDKWGLVAPNWPPEPMPVPSAPIVRRQG